MNYVCGCGFGHGGVGGLKFLTIITLDPENDASYYGLISNLESEPTTQSQRPLTNRRLLLTDVSLRERF